MISIIPLISNSASVSSKTFRTVQRTPVPIGITVIFMSHSFLSSQERSKYFFNFFLYSIFDFWTAKFFFLSSGLGNSFESQSLREFYAFRFFRRNSDLYIYYFNLLHNSQRITFPAHSCLVLYSLYAYLQYSLIIWLNNSSPLNLHELFYCVIFVLI